MTVLVLGAMVMIGKRGSRKQVRRLRDARRGGSFSTFAADFPKDYPAPEILHAVYDGFQHAAASHQLIDDVVVRAGDSLAAVYDAHLVDDYNELNDLDLRGLIIEVAAACNRRVPEAGEARVPVKVRTVREVVEFLERCPLAADSAQAIV